jgi:hypothetical protein
VTGVLFVFFCKEKGKMGESTCVPTFSPCVTYRSDRAAMPIRNAATPFSPSLPPPLPTTPPPTMGSTHSQPRPRESRSTDGWKAGRRGMAALFEREGGRGARGQNHDV